MATGHLITGEKKAGKTTAVRKIVSGALRPLCHGFYTEEIRENGRRTGFRLTTLDGKTAVIAHRDEEHRIQSEFRAGNYVVDLKAFEAIALPALESLPGHKGLIVIDEIGPMQLLSPRFKEAVARILEGPGVLFGTIVAREFPWADDIKARAGIVVHPMTHENRDELTRELEIALTREIGA